MTFFCLVNVEFGKFQQSVSLASFTESALQTVVFDVLLEITTVGHFTEIDGAKIFEHGFDKLHDTVEESPLFVKGQQEVDFAFFGEFA